MDILNAFISAIDRRTIVRLGIETETNDALIDEIDFLRSELDKQQKYSREIEAEYFFALDKIERLERALHNIDATRKRTYEENQILKKKLIEMEAVINAKI